MTHFVLKRPHFNFSIISTTSKKKPQSLNLKQSPVSAKTCEEPAGMESTKETCSLDRHNRADAPRNSETVAACTGPEGVPALREEADTSPILKETLSPTDNHLQRKN